MFRFPSVQDVAMRRWVSVLEGRVFLHCMCIVFCARCVYEGWVGYGDGVPVAYGLIACLEGACWLLGLVPILYWLITKGRALLPSIDNYRYLGLILYIGAICLGFLRYQLKKPTAIAASSDSHDPPPTEDDARPVAEAINDPPPRQQESGGRGGDTKARRWMLVAAARSASLGSVA